MKLYWCPYTRSFSAVWMLEELGVPYDRELVDVFKGAQDALAYRAINPMGKVPAIDDGGVVVAEQGAICAYLADRFPEKGLAPAIGDASRGAYLRWLFFTGNCIEPAYMQKQLGFSVERRQAGWGEYGLVVDTMEQALADGPWLLGERFSAADVMVGCGVFYGLLFGLLEPRPAFEAYRDRCAARPAFQRAQAIDTDGAAAAGIG